MDTVAAAEDFSIKCSLVQPGSDKVTWDDMHTHTHTHTCSEVVYRLFVVMSCDTVVYL